MRKKSKTTDGISKRYNHIVAYLIRVSIADPPSSPCAEHFFVGDIFAPNLPLVFYDKEFISNFTIIPRGTYAENNLNNAANMWVEGV